MERKVFVTVGSTSFDELLTTVSSPEVLKILKSKGYTTVVMQTGRGTFAPPESTILKIQSYDFKENIEEDIKSAALVVSHAGAGSIIESLENHRPLMVVINDKLMDNHQEELAEELEESGYLKCCYCRNLGDTLQEFDTSKLRLYSRADPDKFLNFFDNVMGYG